MEIYDQIHDAAEVAQRSLNGEIIHRLTSSSHFSNEHLQLLSKTTEEAGRLIRWQLRQKREWRAITRTQSIAINGMTLAIRSLCAIIVEKREDVPKEVLEGAEQLLSSVAVTLDDALTTIPEQEEYDPASDFEKLLTEWKKVSTELGLTKPDATD